MSLRIKNPLFLLLIASILFALSFPNMPLWSAAQFPFFGKLFSWISQNLVFLFALPVLHVLQQLRSLRQALFYGAFYGFSSYLLLSLWLFLYDWLAFILVPSIYLYYFSIHFAMNFLLRKTLKKYRLPDYLHYLIFIFSWMLFEYVKSASWVAYTYGSLLYSHYLSPAAMYFSRNFLLQNLAYLLILAPSVCVHALFRKHRSRALLLSVLAMATLNLSFASKIKPGTDESQIELLAKGQPQNKSSSVMPISPDKLNVALLQHNINSWRTEKNTNRQALTRLLELSRRAEQANAELIVWSETAFVPIYRFNRDQDFDPLQKEIRSLEAQLDKDPSAEKLKYLRYQYQDLLLSRDLQSYLSQAKATYLIGTNDFGQTNLFPKEKRWGLYNAMLLIENGEILGTYHKQRLIPFVEEAKWEKSLPRLNQFLRSLGFATYSAGQGSSVLTLPLKDKLQSSLEIYAMICYEDSLPMYWPQYLSASAELRQVLVRQNFDILISVSNDSWSPSPIGSLQHLSSSVSRAVETQRYFLRGSTSGQTVAIDPQGQILERLPANTPGILYFRLPLFSDL